jgi:mannose-1-phosphate guanylyltransferase
MKALVLCAGSGTRLGELCRRRAKPLLTIGDRAIVEHILGSLAASGCDEVWINLHHHAEQFPATLGLGGRFGLRIHYVWESQARGTAGTVADLRSVVGNELLVHYGDILTEHDLGELAAAHRRNRGWATMLVHQRAGSNSVALLAADDRVEAFHERPQLAVDPGLREPWVFSGICVLGAPAIAAIPSAGHPDLPRDLFPALADAGRLHAQRLAGFRCAVDSPERLALARAAIASSTFVPPTRERS